MFTGILIGLGAAYWIYMIYYRYGEFDSHAFQSFAICCGIPLVLLAIYKLL